jgi:hypothetical protein
VVWSILKRCGLGVLVWVLGQGVTRVPVWAGHGRAIGCISLVGLAMAGSRLDRFPVNAIGDHEFDLVSADMRELYYIRIYIYPVLHGAHKM